MYYEITQNNSGGYFLENDDVARTLIIEADSLEEAQLLLRLITEDKYNEYCECCGERWSLCEYDTPTEKPMYNYEEVDFSENYDAIIYSIKLTKKDLRLK